MKSSVTIGKQIARIALVLSLFLPIAGHAEAAAEDAPSAPTHTPEADKDKPEDPKGEETEQEKAVKKIAERLMKEGGALTDEEKAALAAMDGEELAKILQSDKFKEVFKTLDAASADLLMGQLQRTISSANPTAKATITAYLATKAGQTVSGPSMLGSGLNGTYNGSGPSSPISVPSSPASNAGSGFYSGFSSASGTRTTPAEVTPVAPSVPVSPSGSSLQFDESNPTPASPTAGATTNSPVSVAPPVAPAAQTTTATPPAPQAVQVLDPTFMDKIASTPTAPATKYGESGFVVREVAATPSASPITIKNFLPTGAQSDATATSGTSARGAVNYADSNSPPQSRQRPVADTREYGSGPRYQFDARGAVQSFSDREEEPAEEEPKPRREEAVAMRSPRKQGQTGTASRSARSSEGLNIQFSEEVPKAKESTQARIPAAEVAAVVARPDSPKLVTGYAAASLPVPFSGTAGNAFPTGLAPAAIKNPTVNLETTATLASVTEDTTPLTILIKNAQSQK